MNEHAERFITGLGTILALAVVIVFVYLIVWAIYQAYITNPETFMVTVVSILALIVISYTLGTAVRRLVSWYDEVTEFYSLRKQFQFNWDVYANDDATYPGGVEIRLVDDEDE